MNRNPASRLTVSDEVSKRRRISPMPTPLRHVIAAAIVTGLVAMLATPTAQSPTAFGVPSTDQPQPGVAIKAVPGSRAQGWLSQGRSEVLARHGMVATSDPLAAQAGLEILRQGGNAIDAAVATGAVLDVTSQNDTGIGGDLFALVYVAKDKKLYALREDQKRAELERFYGEKGSVSWGNQIRSYVFQPYRMVKDLRTGVQTSDVQAVMDGDLDEFVNGWLRAGCPTKRMQGVKDLEE